MICDCHGEPMWWSSDTGHPNGRWRCRIRKRETDRSYQMRRYDSDPIRRIETNLKRAAQKRRMRLQRRKEQLGG